MAMRKKATRSCEPSQFAFARPRRLSYRSHDMHTIASLRRALGLQTTNQVRNRIDAIKDVLADHLRRGPNNQILLTDDGLETLRQLQELYDSGLTITEASDVLRVKTYKKTIERKPETSGFAPNDTKPSKSAGLVAQLREEIAFLRERVAFLEARTSLEGGDWPEVSEWWQRLREDIDGA